MDDVKHSTPIREEFCKWLSNSILTREHLGSSACFFITKTSGLDCRGSVKITRIEVPFSSSSHYVYVPCWANTRKSVHVFLRANSGQWPITKCQFATEITLCPHKLLASTGMYLKLNKTRVSGINNVSKPKTVKMSTRNEQKILTY